MKDIVVPPYPLTSFSDIPPLIVSWFNTIDHRKQIIPLLLYYQKVSSSLALRQNAYIILTSSLHLGILLSHTITRGGTVQ